MRMVVVLKGKILAYIDLVRGNLTKQVQKQRCEPDLSTSRWTPPPPGMVLVNSDAALFEATRSMGAGVLIRNHRGDFLVACCQHLEGYAVPEYA
jgi:hypothetical protein